MRLNLDYLIEIMWEHLNLIKVFTKKRGRKILFNDNEFFKLNK
jgi:ribosome-interacting GTPase 1